MIFVFLVLFVSCDNKKSYPSVLQYSVITDIVEDSNNSVILCGTRNDILDGHGYKHLFINAMSNGKEVKYKNPSSIFSPKLAFYSEGDFLVAGHTTESDLDEIDKLIVYDCNGVDDCTFLFRYGWRYRLIDMIAVDSQVYLLSYNRGEKCGDLTMIENKEVRWSRKIKIGSLSTVPKKILSANNKIYVVGHIDTGYGLDGHEHSATFFSSFLSCYSRNGDLVYAQNNSRNGTFLSEDISIRGDDLTVVSTAILEDETTQSDVVLSQFDRVTGKLRNEECYTHEGTQTVHAIFQDHSSSILIVQEKDTRGYLQVYLWILKKDLSIAQKVPLTSGLKHHSFSTCLLRINEVLVAVQSYDKRNGAKRAELISYDL